MQTTKESLPYEFYPSTFAISDVACLDFDERILDIGRLASTSYSIPFSAVYFTSFSEEERRLCSFAVAVIRNYVVENLLKVEDLKTLQTTKKIVSAAVGSSAASIAKKALQIERLKRKREKAGIVSSLKSTAQLQRTSSKQQEGLSPVEIELLKLIYKPYTLVELREVCKYLGVTTPNGNQPSTRIDALRLSLISVARRLTTRDLIYLSL
jgi:hypothetical protein